MADETVKIILGDTAISAIEPSSGDRGILRRQARRGTPKTNCENCGAELHGHWCSQCGQAAVDYHRSFRYVILDVLDSFLSWDSKIFATAAWLIVKPWRLTIEFNAGRRVRYLHPLRLYLVASVLFFFAVNNWAKGIHTEPGKMSGKDRAEVAAGINETRAEIEAALQNKDLSPAKRLKIEKMLDDLSKPSAAPSATPAPEQSPSAPNLESPTPKPAAEQTHDFGPLLQLDDDDASKPIGKWLEERAREKMGEHGSKMALFITTLFQNLPYMMLCCIPLFALVLKLLYVRRKIFYVEHLTYALHIHSFFYIAVTAIVFATIGLNHLHLGTLGGLAIALLWTTFVVLIFQSIRKVYRQGWLISIFKFLFGGLMYFIVLFCALFITFIITIALPS